MIEYINFVTTLIQELWKVIRNNFVILNFNFMDFWILLLIIGMVISAVINIFKSESSNLIESNQETIKKHSKRKG